VAEEESVAAELHGHLTQILRTALAGGLQVSEQRARRQQQEAEAERRTATEAAHQLQERKRAERAMNTLLAQQSIAREEAERAAQARRAADTAVEGAVETASKQVPTAFPRSVAEALADSRRNPEESTAKARHQRERGAAKQTADLGR
jgi:hypothetical protein